MPLLTRKLDVSWQIWCPSWYLLVLLSVPRLPKITKRLSHRCYSTRPDRNNLVTWNNHAKAPSRFRRTDNSSGKSQDFFSGHHVDIDPSGQAIGHAWNIRKLRGANDANRQQWGDTLSFAKTKLPSPDFFVPKRTSDQPRILDQERASLSQENHSIRPQEPAPKPPSLNVESGGYRARKGRKYGDLAEEEIYEEMRRASNAGDYPRLREILRIIIQERGEQPNRKHYQALLLVNTSAQHGSAAEVARILQDMEDAGLALDSAAYHAVLRVCIQSTVPESPTDLLRSSQSTLIIFSERKSWKSFANDGSRSRKRAGTTSLSACCEISKLNLLSKPFRAFSKKVSVSRLGSMTC